MITMDGQPSVERGDRFKFSLDGKSTDTKPTKEYNGHKIANGSSFFELDTQNILFYDETTESWLNS